VVSEIRGNSGLGTSDVEVVRYPLGDDDALRSAVTSLIDDPARRSRIGAAARERALTSYDARQKSSRYLKAYRAVAAKKGIDLTV